MLKQVVSFKQNAAPAGSPHTPKLDGSHTRPPPPAAPSPTLPTLRLLASLSALLLRLLVNPLLPPLADADASRPTPPHGGSTTPAPVGGRGRMRLAGSLSTACSSSGGSCVLLLLVRRCTEPAGGRSVRLGQERSKPAAAPAPDPPGPACMAPALTLPPLPLLPPAAVGGRATGGPSSTKICAAKQQQSQVSSSTA